MSTEDLTTIDPSALARVQGAKANAESEGLTSRQMTTGYLKECVKTGALLGVFASGDWRARLLAIGGGCLLGAGLQAVDDVADWWSAPKPEKK